MYQVVEASPQAKAKIISYEDKVGVTETDSKYPFEFMKIGQCFCVPLADSLILSESSLRVTAAKRGKLLGKKFCVLKHKGFGVYEVARIA